MAISLNNLVKQCGSCRAKIVWLYTSNDKRIPVDVETVQYGDTRFDANVHRSHFATCPNASKHRKPRTQTQLSL